MAASYYLGFLVSCGSLLLSWFLSETYPSLIKQKTWQRWKDVLWIFKFDTQRALLIVYIPDKSYSNFIIYSAANFSQFRTLDDGRKFPAVSLWVWLQEIQAYPTSAIYRKPQKSFYILQSHQCKKCTFIAPSAEVCAHLERPSEFQLPRLKTWCCFNTSFVFLGLG